MPIQNRTQTNRPATQPRANAAAPAGRQATQTRQAPPAPPGKVAPRQGARPAVQQAQRPGAAGAARKGAVKSSAGALARSVAAGDLNTQGRRAYFQPAFNGGKSSAGGYFLEVGDIKEEQRDDGALFWNAEFLIHASDNPQHRPGTTINYYRDFKFPGSAISDIVRFVMNGFGYTEEETFAFMGLEFDANGAATQIGDNQISGPDQVLKGLFVRLVANDFTSKKSRKPRLGMRWIQDDGTYEVPAAVPVDEQYDDDLSPEPLTDEDVPF